MLDRIKEIEEENKKLKVGMGVDLIKFVVDFNFFPDGTKGFITENNGEYLGITVEFTEPKKIKGKTFGFNAEHLKLNGNDVTIKPKAKLKTIEEYTTNELLDIIKSRI